MKKIKNLFFSISGSIDSMIARIQNHEALSEAALNDLKKTIHQGALSLSQLRRSLETTENEIQASIVDEALWLRRAKEEGAAGNKEQAIECLRRNKQAISRRIALEKQKAQSASSFEGLQKKLENLKNVESTLSLKQKELKARQKCMSHDVALGQKSDPAEILSQWEDAVGGYLPSTEPFISLDPLADSYLKAEEKKDLEAELEALLNA